jgi:hypothetical protein
VTGAVNAEVFVGEIALHTVLEGENIFAGLDEFSDDFVSRSVSSMLVDIAT